MSSKARQFRRRPLAEEGEEEEVEGVAAAAAAAGAVVGAGGGARKGVAKAPLLSFGDEGEEVSQPAPRKRVVSVAVRASGAERSGAATAAHRPAAGREYSAQRLKEVRLWPRPARCPPARPLTRRRTTHSWRQRSERSPALCDPPVSLLAPPTSPSRPPRCVPSLTRPLAYGR